jgi:hypothetical protein
MIQYRKLTIRKLAFGKCGFFKKARVLYHIKLRRNIIGSNVSKSGEISFIKKAIWQIVFFLFLFSPKTQQFIVDYTYPITKQRLCKEKNDTHEILCHNACFVAKNKRIKLAILQACFIAILLYCFIASLLASIFTFYLQSFFQ